MILAKWQIWTFFDFPFFFFRLPPFAPHLGCLSNEQDIPEEVGSSEEQLNSVVGGEKLGSLIDMPDVQIV